MKNWLDYDNFAVFGMGRSGVAAANLLAKRGKKVIASDTRTLDEMGDVAGQLDDGVELVGGGNIVGDAEVVVVSPGLKPNLAVFEELRGRDVPAISEIELAYAATDARILAITGTDGKSTTTVLVGHILEHAGVECVVGGNLGTPLCALVDEVSSDGVIVAEVSAFQLWTTHQFAPHAFGLTNIAFDHLDYFDNYDEYVGAKRQVMQNAGAASWGVFNAEDEHIRSWQHGYEGRAVVYGLSEEVVEAADENSDEEADDTLWLADGSLWARLDGGEATQWLPSVAGLPIAGAHNMLNLMCAAGLALSVGVSLDEVADAATSFKALPHRMEYVGAVDGVQFYDDSKATNVHAALAGLRSLEGDLVAIVGGVDKGLQLIELIDFLREREAPVVIIGEIRERLGSELLAAGYPERDIYTADSMQEAVEKAYKLAKPDGTVSLSPACSSFDMFDSYAHRGDVFQQIVRGLS
ncbi:UDP-N-acetylmuramoyl-L-alanine--D-glutamate ligase [Persicimonas caeni]|uniref:UDP-N-acetylmuramoylalanine--D-glutamate ligase n=1 Tax=Persicimonas caeni TaxID=2292766 RepID=A0A4Y6Q214_PERCE|nr:UDP-N-acetylmuramoyl-L-alanine--D-glutamate ligase [Persicimonas caeni]QDG54638.1 UDP-N-acetylmuramoyl-L-alanine--D-glutamate ligase [Persicimonas caeni]QED35859.1 UDP-N-acetylmuramoyl-L-alanine--D-glutamate ligase [Persicimonas caeni]